MKLTIAIHILVCVLLSGSATLAQDLKPVYMEIQHRSREVEVIVNGVPVGKSGTDTPSYFLRISSFLKQGKNRITLKWKPVNKPASPLELEILEWPQGEARKDAGELVKYTHRESEHINKSIEKTFSFSIESPYHWSWEQGEHLKTLTGDDLNAIRKEVKHLHTVFSETNIERILDTIKMVISEMGLKRPEVTSRSKERYKALMKDPNWNIMKIEIDELHIQPYGQLTMVTGSSPIIRTVEEVNSSKIKINRLYYSKINGEWMLVRMR